MNIIELTFKIICVILFAKALAGCFTTDSKTMRKLQRKFMTEADDNRVNFIYKTIRCVIYIIAVLVVIALLGINLNTILAGLGIGSVVITLAAQNLAKDLLGGFVIFTDKPFKVGDWIQFGDYEGTVEDITYRSTRLRTFENSIVNIPNSIIANESLINCSKIEKRRYKINLGLTLETPLNKVKTVEEKIKTMLKEKENVMDDSIIVKFDKITDNTINLLIYAFTDSVDYESFLKQKEEINFKIMQILESENVELAYDTKTVYVKY